MVNKRIDGRISAAKRAHRDATKHLASLGEQQSAELLAELLRGPISVRFAALTSGGLKGRPDLVAADRLKLLESIRKPVGEKHAIDVGFASRFEVFRARMRYRMVPMIVGCTLLALLATLSWIAFARTPMMRVYVVGQADWVARVTHPDGTVTEDTIRPGAEKYELMDVQGEYGRLRKWVSGSGYDRFYLPVRILRR